MSVTTPATPEGDTRYDALLARDPRYDGVFFVGVTTTGIYCRPICPAPTPRRVRSVRRFNALFAARYGRPPSAMKTLKGRAARSATGSAAGRSPASSGEVVMRLHFRPPFRWHELLSFLRGRAIPGVEAVTGDEYRRTFRVGRA